LEQYVQEAGRSGRDGNKSNCILLHDPQEDRKTHEALLSRSRLRPEQLYRLGEALAAWAGEGRKPDLKTLALSAELGDRTTNALLVPIEEAGIVKFDEEGIIEVLVPTDEVDEKVRSLAGQFANLRTQDSRRLDSLADYAKSTVCRAVYLRSYFGEEDGEDCGLCDICRGRPERPATFFQPVTAPPRRGKKKRKGRGRKKTGANNENRPSAEAAGADGAPKKRRRRRRRGRRGGGAAAENSEPKTSPSGDQD
jgi:superfamily II DNA/RNA helicase